METGRSGLEHIKMGGLRYDSAKRLAGAGFTGKDAVNIARFTLRQNGVDIGCSFRD